MEKLTKYAITFLLVVAAGATAAGCGDDESSAGDDVTIKTSSLTKPQFVKRADEICQKGSEKLSVQIVAYEKKHKSSSKDKGELTAEAIQAVVLPEFEDQFDAIEKMGAPEGDEEEVEDLLASMRSSVAAVEKRRRLSLVSNVAPDFRQAGKLAREYGIEACSYG